MKLTHHQNMIAVFADNETKIVYSTKWDHNYFGYSWLSEGKWYYQFAVFGCRGFGSIDKKVNCYKAAMQLYRYLRRNNLFKESWNISFKNSAL